LHKAEVNAAQLDLVGEVLDPRDTGAMDVGVLATHLSASARRLEAALYTKLFAAVEAHGGIGYNALLSQIVAPACPPPPLPCFLWV
jgi:hypothetical protein